MSAEPPAPSDAGARLAAHERRLLLLLAHLAGRAVRARVELADLAQEVYLRTLAHPAGLPSQEPGDGPLWGILAHEARHVVIDVARALRTQKRAGSTRALEPSDWSHVPAPRAPGPHTEVATAETAEQLTRAFLALPAEHRRVLGLRQFEGLTAEETAKRMGRSTVAVHSLYRRALEGWQGALAKKPPARGESAPQARPSES
ncbi:MAG: RNA polymerase sigma factor [Planctomycetota bacterium]